MIQQIIRDRLVHFLGEEIAVVNLRIVLDIGVDSMELGDLGGIRRVQLGLDHPPVAQSQPHEKICASVLTIELGRGNLVNLKLVMSASNEVASYKLRLARRQKVLHLLSAHNSVEPHHVQEIIDSAGSGIIGKIIRLYEEALGPAFFDMKYAGSAEKPGGAVCRILTVADRNIATHEHARCVFQKPPSLDRNRSVGRRSVSAGKRNHREIRAVEKFARKLGESGGDRPDIDS